MLSVIGLLVIGGPLVYFWDEYAHRPPGIKNDGIMFSSTMARGLVGWTLGIVLTGGYVLLYWFPATLDGLIRVVDPLSYTLTGNPASQWFLYGTIYTVAVLVMGVRAILKYRHSRYQIIRTLSVMSAQLFLALPHPATPRPLQPAGVLLLVLLAAEVRLPLARHDRLPHRRRAGWAISWCSGVLR